MFQRYPKGFYEHQVSPGLDGDRICRSFITHSDDDGLTWSKPKDITASVKRPRVVTSIASGPGIGIQLARGQMPDAFSFRSTRGRLQREKSMPFTAMTAAKPGNMAKLPPANPKAPRTKSRWLS